MQTPLKKQARGGATAWTGLSPDAPFAEAAFTVRLLLTCPDVVYVFDVKARRAVYRNRRLHAVLGYEDRDVERPDALVPQQLIHPDDRLSAERLLEELQAMAPGTCKEVELRLAEKDGGRWRHMRVRYTPLSRAADGRNELVLGTITDVSEARWAQAEAERANAAKDEFLARVSHDLRTPLHGIGGAASLLEGTPLDADQRELVRTIARSAAALEGMIDDVLDLGRLGAGKLTLDARSFAPLALLEDVLQELGVKAEAKGLPLLLALRSPVPELVGDPGRLRQIAANLIGNAVKFTEKGHVRVSVSYDAHASELGITVADTGAGIARDEVASLFEPFQQGRAGAVHGGVGLGLSICRELTRAMGGRIAVKSREGAGSAFAVTVPLPRAGTDAARPLAGRRVVILSDNPASGAAWRDTLSELGAHGELLVIDGPGDHVGGLDLSTALLVDDWTGAARAAAKALPTTVGTAPRILLASASTEPLEGFELVPRPARVSFVASRLGGDAPPRHLRLARPSGAPLAGHVLVVDDEPSNRSLLVKMLSRCGLTARAAASGREALALAAAERFDLAIVDGRMPDLDGPATTAALREAGFTGPVVGLTASALPATRAACLKAGMVDVWTKPLRADELAQRLARWLEGP